MTKPMTSRERLRRAIACEPADYVPCCFMSFAAMRGRCYDPYEQALREQEMGLDPMLFVPIAPRGERPHHPDLRGLPVRPSPEVRISLWEEDTPDPRGPILHKVYHTPAGDLSTRVVRTVDWPHGTMIPFVDDYQVPRALKPLVTGPQDLEPLRFMLQPPTPAEIARFRQEMVTNRAFVEAHGALLAGGWGVGADMVGWLCGLEAMPLLAIDQPEFLQDLLTLIGEWNRTRMRVILEEGVDLYIRRGWYESTDFWSPRLYARYILPGLREEVALAHEYGTPFGYIMTTGALPLMDLLLEAGVDVLIGVDPLQRGPSPLATLRDRFDGRICLWGGVNGAITVEEGTPEEVRRAVIEALETMRGVPGFILSPVDNITRITRRTWENLAVFIETWQAHRGGQ